MKKMILCWTVIVTKIPSSKKQHALFSNLRILISKKNFIFSRSLPKNNFETYLSVTIWNFIRNLVQNFCSWNNSIENNEIIYVYFYRSSALFVQWKKKYVGEQFPKCWSSCMLKKQKIKCILVKTFFVHTFLYTLYSSTDISAHIHQHPTGISPKLKHFINAWKLVYFFYFEHNISKFNFFSVWNPLNRNLGSKKKHWNWLILRVSHIQCLKHV